jgi:O-antigen biosynthesis protein
MNFEKIKEELLLAESASKIEKDILIVVHDQYDYVKNCIDSIFKNTKNFNLFIWDNNSENKTANYLEKISKKNKNIKLYKSSENVGFIIPNNAMMKDTNSPYVILLNSDTEVRQYWDKVLIGFLENNKSVAVAGFEGGMLDESGMGVSKNNGYEIDYVCGFCMCVPRKTYLEFGLFDEDNIKFAYCEDSDFCLRLREKNKKIYACYSTDLIVHYGSKTSAQVLKENDFSQKVYDNLNYLQKRWAKYLNRPN